MSGPVEPGVGVETSDKARLMGLTIIPMPTGTSAVSALGALTGRIGRHSVIYGGALFGTLALGLVSVAVFTRFIEPREFGDLAVLLFFASLITVGLNLGLLQGAFRAAYGTSDEEGLDD